MGERSDRALWGVARGLALIALAMAAQQSSANRDAHSVWLSASDLLKQAERESRQEAGHEPQSS